MTGLILLGVAGAGYLAASIRYQKTLYADREPLDEHRGRGLLWLAFAIHTAALVAWGLELGRCPDVLPPETLALMSWLMMGLYLTVSTMWKVQILGAFASPLATLMLIASLATAPASGQAAVQRPPSDLLLVMHIGAVLLGYAAFMLATVMAGLYFFQAFLLKRKMVTGVFQKIPSLDRLDRATYQLIALGFPAMVVGIVLAFVRVEALGHGRFWSPETLLGMITCAIYAIYIHARMIGGWQGRKVNLLLLVGFVFLMATYVGMGVLPSSVHQGKDVP